MNINDFIDYNPVSGEFIWTKKLNKSGLTKLGGPAGYKNKNGYVIIGFNKKYYKAHRLAWFIHYNELPKNQIDHINGDRSDNRIQNLRQATPMMNSWNKKKHRMGKLVGCYKDKRCNAWVAQTNILKKTVHIGSFKTEQEAHDAYVSFLANHERRIEKLEDRT